MRALDDPAAREDDPGPDQLIAGEAMPSPEQSEAAAEREPGDPHGDATACRQRSAHSVQRVAQTPQKRALLAAHSTIAVSGTAQNQGPFYDRFEHVIYLRVPV